MALKDDENMVEEILIFSTIIRSRTGPTFLFLPLFCRQLLLHLQWEGRGAAVDSEQKQIEYYMSHIFQ